MDNLHSFLSQAIRAKGISIDEFCEQINISRATFYRYTKEPEKISENTIKRISTVLNFTAEQQNELKNFVYGNEELTSSEMKELENVFMMKSPFYSGETIYEFDFYSDDISSATEFEISHLSINSLSTRIIESIDKSRVNETQEIERYHNNFTVSIYNCKKTAITSSLARLFYNIEKRIEDDLKKDSCHIRITHFIPEYKNEPNKFGERIEKFKYVLPLLSTCEDYAVYGNPLNQEVWSANNDLCIIKYSVLGIHKDEKLYEARRRSELHEPNAKKYKYFIIKFSEKGKAYCYTTQSYNLYKYFTVDSQGIIKGYESRGGVWNLNLRMWELGQTHKKIMWNRGLCFDNVGPEFWKYLKKQGEGSGALDLFVKVFDPDWQIQGGNASERLDQIIQKNAERYKQNEDHETINIVYKEGLQELVKKRMIGDFAFAGIPQEVLNSLKFGSEEIKKILTGVIECIENQQKKSGLKKQKYYILCTESYDSEVVACGNSYAIFKGEFSCICAEAFGSLHRNDTRSFYQDKELVDRIFDYIEGVTTKRKSITESGIRFLNDDEAIEYLSNLSKSVEDK